MINQLALIESMRNEIRDNIVRATTMHSDVMNADSKKYWSKIITDLSKVLVDLDA